MICCDKCEDWFHGKCVNVTKAMGVEMEERGVEWVCPNCIKKHPHLQQRQLAVLGKVNCYYFTCMNSYELFVLENFFAQGK